MTVVVVMARALDAPGDTIKTRLSGALPSIEDRRRLHAACVADSVEAARQVEGVLVRVASTPDGHPESFRAVGVEPGHVFLQEGDDLGERERAVFARLFRQGAHRVVLVGSDIPELTAAILREAVEAIEGDPQRVAIGPAADGGYYLLACSGPVVPDLFSGVRWSTHFALADTLRRCEFENRRVTFLPVLEDLDTDQALARLRRALADDPAAAPRTAAALLALPSTDARA